MIASQNETISSTMSNRLHASAVSLDTCGCRVVKAATMHCAPEVGIQFEVRAAPVLPHGAEDFLEMLLHFRMRSIQSVPGCVPPSGEGHLAGNQRFVVRSANEPLRLLLEDMGILLGDERCNPDCWLKAALANFFQDGNNVAAKSLARF